MNNFKKIVVSTMLFFFIPFSAVIANENLDLLKTYLKAGEDNAQQMLTQNMLIQGNYTQINQNFQHEGWQGALRSRGNLSDILLCKTVAVTEYFSENGDYFSQNKSERISADPEESMEPDPNQSVKKNTTTARYYIGGSKYGMRSAPEEEPSLGNSWTIAEREEGDGYMNNEESLFAKINSVYFGYKRKVIDRLISCVENGKPFIVDITVKHDEKNQSIWFTLGVGNQAKYVDIEFSANHPEKVLTYIQYAGSPYNIQYYTKFEYNNGGNLIGVQDLIFNQRGSAKSIDECVAKNASVVYQIDLEKMIPGAVNPMNQNPMDLIQDGDVVGDHLKNIHYIKGKPGSVRVIAQQS